MFWARWCYLICVFIKDAGAHLNSGIKAACPLQKGMLPWMLAAPAVGYPAALELLPEARTSPPILCALGIWSWGGSNDVATNFYFVTSALLVANRGMHFCGRNKGTSCGVPVLLRRRLLFPDVTEVTFFFFLKISLVGFRTLAFECASRPELNVLQLKKQSHWNLRVVNDRTAQLINRLFPG